MGIICSFLYPYSSASLSYAAFAHAQATADKAETEILEQKTSARYIMKTQNNISWQLLAACASVTLLFASGATAQNVGIGISNPQSKLTVNGNMAVGSGYNVTAPTNGAIIQGNVGIATTSPRFQLDVLGLGAFSQGIYPATINTFVLGWNNIQPGQGTAELVNMTTGGGAAFEFVWVNENTGVKAPTAANIISNIQPSGAYIQNSDKRLKTDVQPLRYGLKELMELQPREYDFHSAESIRYGIVKLAATIKHQIGFIAQDVVQIVPEAVEKPKDEANDFYRMDYASLLPVVVSGMQELKHQQDETFSRQQAKIREQETKIAGQQTTISELKAELKVAENKLGQQEAEIAAVKAANEKLTSMGAKIEVLEKAMATMQEKENRWVRTVALEQR